MLALWLMAVGAAHAAETLLKVATVIDGDTIVLANKETVRYAGIDTPEFDHERHLAQPFAESAKELNRQLVGGKRVRLQFDEQRRDAYGRLIAYVLMADGIMANQVLVAQGLACCAFHPPNLKYSQQLLNAQREAMTAGRGLWKTLRAEKPIQLIGNRRSFRFHMGQCPLGRKTAPTNRVLFSSRWAALWEGFAPCKRCQDLPYHQIVLPSSFRLHPSSLNFPTGRVKENVAP